MENKDNNLTITFKLQDPRKMCVFSGTINNDQFWTNGFKAARTIKKVEADWPLPFLI